MLPRVRALFVDDEELLSAQYVENLECALRDVCGLEVEFESVQTVEEAKRRLPRGQADYRLVVTDMLFRPVGDATGPLQDRGREVILQARKSNGVVVAAISQGDTTRYPTLHEDSLSYGADVFRYKQQIQGSSRNQEWSGWDELAEKIGHCLQGSDETVNLTAPKSLFVVYGRNRKLVEDLFDLLGALKLEPLEWDKLVDLAQERSGGNGNPDVMSIISTGFAVAHAALVLFSPDDFAYLSEEYWSDDEPEFEKVAQGQPRPNVLFEAGYALGARFERTLIVSIGNVRPVSDLAGRHILRLNNSPESRKALAQRLAGMGLGVDTSGNRWLGVGDFSL